MNEEERVFHDVKMIKCTQTVSGEDTDQWCDIYYRKSTLEGKTEKKERLENIEEVSAYSSTANLASVYLTSFSGMATFFNFGSAVECHLLNRILTCHKED